MTGRVEDRAPQPKGDPETFALRGRPRRVIRFRKGVVTGIAGVVAAGLIGVASMSLRPPRLHLAGTNQGSEPSNGAAPEVLAAAPATYDKVPQLGPPLPGDLGPPILAQQRALTGDDGVTGRESVSEGGRAETLQRMQSEAHAALASGVLMKLDAAREDASTAASSPSGANGDRGDGRPTGSRVTASGESPWSLSPGSIIPASLVTALDSASPGTVIAQVTENVRDSATGRMILVPQGSRLIGSYDSHVGYHQKRLGVSWDRLVFPDGSSVELDKVAAVDAGGTGGLEDSVDFHEGGLVKAVLMSAFLGAAGEAGMGGGPTGLAAAFTGAERQTQEAGGSLVSRALEVEPTLKVRAGWPVRALVTRALHLKPWNSDDH